LVQGLGDHDRHRLADLIVLQDLQPLAVGRVDRTVCSQ
jgi:hypothetical protein